jgi:hypothetical protein
MKMVKERTRTVSAVNDERRQVLPSKVIWYRTIDRFEVFRNNVEGLYGQIGAGNHMPSDLISNIRKKLQDRFTILASLPIGPRRIK